MAAKAMEESHLESRVLGLVERVGVAIGREFSHQLGSVVFVGKGGPF